MSSVVDASVLVAATTDAGSAGTWAEQIVAQGDLFAPHLVLVEAANVLRRLEAAKRLSLLEATAAQRDVLALDITLLPFAPFAERIWALRGSITSYDAWYVAIAEASGLPLATLDLRLSRVSGPSCRFLLPR